MIRVELLGTTFQVESDGSEEYLSSLVEYLERRVAEVQGMTETRDPLKTAILAALLTADDLFQARATGLPERDAEEISRITHALIERIDANLPRE